MMPLFADIEVSFISLIERLGALGLLCILIVWFMRIAWPKLVQGFQDSLKAIGDSHLVAITKVVDQHKFAEDRCNQERIDNAQIARDVAEKAAAERDKDREIRVQLANTLSGIGETLRKINKDG